MRDLDDLFAALQRSKFRTRGCLNKWHYISPGMPLCDEQIEYVLGAIQRWLTLQD